MQPRAAQGSERQRRSVPRRREAPLPMPPRDAAGTSGGNEERALSKTAKIVFNTAPSPHLSPAAHAPSSSAPCARRRRPSPLFLPRAAHRRRSSAWRKGVRRRRGRGDTVGHALVLSNQIAHDAGCTGAIALGENLPGDARVEGGRVAEAAVEGLTAGLERFALLRANRAPDFRCRLGIQFLDAAIDGFVRPLAN